jgi:hypothetical protein
MDSTLITQINEMINLQRILKKESYILQFIEVQMAEKQNQIYQHIKKIRLSHKFLFSFHILSRNIHDSNCSQKFLISHLQKRVDSDFLSGDSIKIFQTICKKLRKNLDLLSDSLVELYNLRPLLFDILVFSTIPSIFHLISFQEDISKFLQFIQIVKEKSFEMSKALSSVLFLTIPFVTFMNSILDEIQLLFFNISDEKSSQICCEEFIIQWKKYSEFCPQYIREWMLIFDNSSEIFYQVCFIYSFQNFSKTIYHLYTHFDNLQQFLQGIFVFREDISNSLLETKNNQYFDGNYSETFFTIQDFMVLQHLSQIANQFQKKFPIINDTNFEQQQFEDLKLIPFQFPNQKTKLSLDKITKQETSLGFLLRQVLIQFDCHNFVNHHLDSSNVFELLKKNFFSVSKEKQFILFSLIEELKKHCSKNSVDLSLNSFNHLLSSQYQERQVQISQKFLSLSQLNQQLVQYSIYLQHFDGYLMHYNNIFLRRIMKNYLLKDHIEIHIINEYYLDDEQFFKFFNETTKKLKSFLQDSNLSNFHVEGIFHNFLMKKLPFEKFLELNPSHAQKDQMFFDYLNEKQAFLLQIVLDNLNHSLPDYLEFLDKAKYYVNLVFSSPLPVESLTYFCKAMSEGANFLTILGEEPGGDNLIPLSTLLLLHQKHHRFYSKIQYMKHFLEKPFQSKHTSLPFGSFETHLTYMIGAIIFIETNMNPPENQQE